MEYSFDYFVQVLAENGITTFAALRKVDPLRLEVVSALTFLHHTNFLTGNCLSLSY